jgi:hypothetical protein
MIRRIVLELASGLRQIQGVHDIPNDADIPQLVEGHTLVRVSNTYILYKEGSECPSTTTS